MTFRLESVAYESQTARMPLTGTVNFSFQAGGTPAAPADENIAAPAIKFNVANRNGEAVVPGSVNFTLAGKRYFDRLGSLYTDLDVATGAATSAGSINYSTGEVSITSWAAGQSAAIAIDSLLTTSGDNTVSGATFRIPVSPIRSGSLQILATKAEGGMINVTASIDGTISGTGVRGSVNYETGVVGVEFGEMVTAAGNETQAWYDPANVVGANVWKPAFVFAETIRFNAVAFSYLPLDANILGLDPVRLPQDGKVPIFRRGGFAVIGHTKKTGPLTVSAAQTIDLVRERLSRVRVVGNDGATISTGYTADLEAGTITFNDVTGYSQPVMIEDRVEDLLQVSDVQISGQLAFTRQITHDYPLGSYVSSALITNDLKSRVSHTFDQASWDSVTWQDTASGGPAPATYNTTLAPIEVTNAGSVTERWALRFTSNTAFQVIGEHVGVIADGTINADCAPINPTTGVPYFTVRELGWGTGWSVGNVLRINTVGAMAPIWIVRTVQQGATTVEDDSFTVLVRGDVDRP
jgi:hypothetical protein